MTAEISAAKATQTEMEQKLSEARERLEAAQAGADGVSFQAHCGDKGAKATLAKFNADAATASAEVRSLEAALAEAKRRVAQAEADANDHREQEKARQALERVAAFEERGDKVNQAVEALVGELVGFERDWRDLQMLGYAPTSTWSLAQVNVVLAVHTKLQGVGLHIRPLQTHEKKELPGLLAAWAGNIRSRASARLGRNAKPRRAA